MYFLALAVFLTSADSDYVFIKSTRTDCAIQKYNSTGSYLFVGFVDENGDFITEKTIVMRSNKTSDKPRPDVIKTTGGHEASASFIEYNIINKPKCEGEDVYEYRSGKLIIGQLTRNFFFIPASDSKPIDFSEYIYSPTAHRIYNLPGKFVTYAEYKAQQTQKKQ